MQRACWKAPVRAHFSISSEEFLGTNPRGRWVGPDPARAAAGWEGEGQPVLPCLLPGGSRAGAAHSPEGARVPGLSGSTVHTSFHRF